MKQRSESFEQFRAGLHEMSADTEDLLWWVDYWYERAQYWNDKYNTEVKNG